MCVGNLQIANHPVESRPSTLGNFKASSCWFSSKKSTSGCDNTNLARKNGPAVKHPVEPNKNEPIFLDFTFKPAIFIANATD